MATRKTAAPKAAVATKSAGIVSAADINTLKAELEGKPRRPGVKTIAEKVAAATAKPATARKATKPTKANVAAKVAGMNLSKKLDVKKPVKAAVVKYKGFVIPVTRKSSDSDEGVPTIEVKGLTEVIKVASLLPAGCTYTGSGTTLMLYNRSGALIAELRQADKK